MIPNKVYQGLAIGRAVVTAATPAFLPALRADEAQGLVWARPGEPESICKAVERIHQRRGELTALGKAARRTYRRYYSNRVIRDVLSELLDAGKQPDLP
ncbi:glycosyltransferase [Thauera phenylacetica]